MSERTKNQYSSEVRVERVRRQYYLAYFEGILDELKDQGDIKGWKKSQIPWVDHIADTELGPVPFAITPSHRKAQKKRNKHPELRHTTISLLPQREKVIKPTSVVKEQILSGIENFFAEVH